MGELAMKNFAINNAKVLGVFGSITKVGSVEFGPLS
jgi:hypothetical protein